MRSSIRLTAARAAARAITLLAFAPAGFAQSNSNGGERGGTTAARNDRDDDTDYGGIGLLGLAVLVSLGVEVEADDWKACGFEPGLPIQQFVERADCHASPDCDT